MPTGTVRFEGGRELEAALKELRKATAKSVVRRAGTKALKPFLDAVQANAPVDDPKASPGRKPQAYKKSWKIGTKLKRSAARGAKDGASQVEIYAGSTDGKLGSALEFGTVERFQATKGGKTVGRVTAHPHARPAWDATAMPVLDGFRGELKTEIDKAAAKAAAKIARRAAAGGT